MNKPLIGITTDLKDENNSIEQSYSTALVRHGAIPVLIPTLSDNVEYLEDIVNRIDGLLIPGSRDMDPKYYNEKPHTKIKPMSKERTKTEFYILEKSLNNNLPVFGICGGMQFLNVFFGGSLYQDMYSLLDGILDHEKGAIHVVQIHENTILSSIIQHPSISVNSFHHQSINKLGKGLKLNAESSDGIIEGVEAENGFVLGVQWHPELENNENSKKIFCNFIDNCKKE